MDKNKKKKIPVVRRLPERIEAEAAPVGTSVQSPPLIPLPERPKPETPVPVVEAVVPAYPSNIEQNPGIMTPAKIAPVETSVPVVQRRMLENQAPDRAETEAPNLPPVVNRDPYATRRARLEAENERLSQPVEKSEDSRLKSGFEGLMRGLAEYFNPKLGFVRGWDEFFTRLAGAGGSFAGGMINDKWDEEDQRMRDLQRNQEEIGALDKRQTQYVDTLYRSGQIEKMQSDAELNRKKFEETKKKNADLEYDKGFRRAMQKVKLGYRKGENPALDAELARYGIDIQQFDTNNRTFWQGQNLMTFDERGEAVPVIGGDGKPVTDITRAPVTVEFDGQKYTVSQTTAFQGVTNAGRGNTSIVNRDAEDDNRFNQKMAEFDGDIAGLQTKIKERETQLNAIPSPATTKEEYDARERLTREITDLKGDLAKVQRTKQNYPKPVKRQQNPSPNVAGKYAGQVFASPESLQQYFPGKTPEQIRQIVTSNGGTFQK